MTQPDETGTRMDAGLEVSCGDRLSVPLCVKDEVACPVQSLSPSRAEAPHLPRLLRYERALVAKPEGENLDVAQTHHQNSSCKREKSTRRWTGLKRRKMFSVPVRQRLLGSC